MLPYNSLSTWPTYYIDIRWDQKNATSYKIKTVFVSYKIKTVFVSYEIKTVFVSYKNQKHPTIRGEG